MEHDIECYFFYSDSATHQLVDSSFQSLYDIEFAKTNMSNYYIIFTDWDTLNAVYRFPALDTSGNNVSIVNVVDLFGLGLNLVAKFIFSSAVGMPFEFYSITIPDNCRLSYFFDESVYTSPDFLSYIGATNSSGSGCLSISDLDTLRTNLNNDLLGQIMPQLGSLSGEISSLGGNLSGEFGSLSGEISSLGGNLSGEFGNLTGHVSNEISNLNGGLQTSISSLDTKLDNLEFPAVDLSTLDTKLNSLDTKMDINHGLIQSLTNDFDLDGVVNAVKSFNFASLNGSSGSFPDGTDVLVVGYTAVFKVVASQFYLSATQTQRIVYLLENGGKRFLVPETAVKLPDAGV